MGKKYFFISAFALLVLTGFGQTNPRDTVPESPSETLDFDTTLDYDDLLAEMDLFLDSLLMPRSYFLASAGGGSGYFNYIRGTALRQRIEVKKQMVLTPTIGYYHKKGPGLTVSGNITDNDDKLALYQVALTPSFDFVQTTDWFAGVSYTRYFTKDSLEFYSSPLENEVSGYVTWRKPWLQPSITATYGWGSRSEFVKREKYIKLLRLKRRGITIGTGTNTTEDIADFSITGSLRHSFYWTGIATEKDYIKFIPQLSFSAGTQKFGFNRTTSTYPVNVRNASNIVYYTGDVDIDEKTKFQPISLSLYLRPEYNIGKFFIQPQFILDYYIPAEDLTALFAISAGIML
jgi:hypothetical protein